MQMDIPIRDLVAWTSERRARTVDRGLERLGAHAAREVADVALEVPAFSHTKRGERLRQPLGLITHPCCWNHHLHFAFDGLVVRAEGALEHCGDDLLLLGRDLLGRRLAAPHGHAGREREIAGALGGGG
jgi:hypothetical protein